MMRTLKIIGIIIVSSLSFIGAFASVLFAIGYRPILVYNNTPDWEVIGNITAIIACIASIAIPIMIAILQGAVSKQTTKYEETVEKLDSFFEKYQNDIKDMAAINRGEEELIWSCGNASSHQNANTAGE